jgi:hypothetical protein
MKYITTLLITIAIISCRNRPEKFIYETSIASKVYEAQLKYLDITLMGYARFSKIGEFYFNESSYLDKTAVELQSKIKNGGVITEDEKRAFYDHFEKTFKHNGLIDFEILNQLKELPIKTVSDVDLLRVYIKNNFVSILLNNKLLPFNAWSTMASAKEWTVKYGQPFEVKLASTAWNTQLPNEWFLVKENLDTLTKENIIDTLYQDKDGVVTFSTKHYKIGENKLMFMAKMKTPKNDPILSREVIFYVK